MYSSTWSPNHAKSNDGDSERLGVLADSEAYAFTKSLGAPAREGRRASVRRPRP